MDAPGPTPRLIDSARVAARLGTSIRHVRRLVLEKRIPYLKVGHFVRFDPEEIEEWLERARVSDTGHQQPDTG